MKKQSNLSRLLDYAGTYRILTYLSWVLAAAGALLALVPFGYIWRILREVIEVAPRYENAVHVTRYGWMAVAFAVVAVLTYIAGLMCSHLAAFRIATNLRLAMVKHIATLPLGAIEQFGSGKLRRTISETAGSAETYLAHQLPDQAKAMATIAGLLALLLAFDWRLGLLSLVPVALAFLVMARMTGKKMQEQMTQYQNALADMSGEAVEYVRGIPVVKTFGQTVAFVGPSGGGKSTLAALIARFFDPQSGKISIGGVNVKDIDKSELMDTVSFVFQNSRLIKGSILDNVRMGKPNATDGEVLAALSAAQCMDIIEKFPDGVRTVIGSQGVYLSGGETQRLAIARAMLKNAPVLILDEATAFADPDNETKVQAAFNELAKGRTVIMIAHRLSTVVNADRIFVLKEGHLAESGSFTALSGQTDSLFGMMWRDYQRSVQWKVEKEA